MSGFTDVYTHTSHYINKNDTVHKFTHPWILILCVDSWTTVFMFCDRCLWIGPEQPPPPKLLHIFCIFEPFPKVIVWYWDPSFNTEYNWRTHTFPNPILVLSHNESRLIPSKIVFVDMCIVHIYYVNMNTQCIYTCVYIFIRAGTVEKWFRIDSDIFRMRRGSSGVVSELRFEQQVALHAL